MLLFYAVVEKLGENPLHKVMAVSLVQNCLLEPSTREGGRGNNITINHTLLTILSLLPCGADKLQSSSEDLLFFSAEKVHIGSRAALLEVSS